MPVLLCALRVLCGEPLLPSRSPDYGDHRITRFLTPRSSAQSPSSHPLSCLSADRAEGSLLLQSPCARPAGTPAQTAANGSKATLYGWHVQQPASADQPPPACNKTRGYPVPRTPPSLLKSSAAAHAPHYFSPPHSPAPLLHAASASYRCRPLRLIRSVQLSAFCLRRWPWLPLWPRAQSPPADAAALPACKTAPSAPSPRGRELCCSSSL